MRYFVTVVRYKVVKDLAWDSEQGRASNSMKARSLLLEKEWKILCTEAIWLPI
jgi:hypothetical protein